MVDQTVEHSPISLVQEIERTDAIASSLFEVLMALGAAAVAVVFTVDVVAVRLVSITVGVIVAIAAVMTMPDVVFAQHQPDRSEASLRAYLKRRQRQTQGAVLVILTIGFGGGAAAFGYAMALSDDSAGAGIITAVGGVTGGFIGAVASRNDLWPPEIRGKVPRPKD